MSKPKRNHGHLTRRTLANALSSLAICLGASGALAQASPAPSFQDPQHRFEKPDISALRVLRFTVEDDYPPFGFALPDGTLAGFNVDLARAICEELRVSCTVQQIGRAHV